MKKPLRILLVILLAIVLLFLGYFAFELVVGSFSVAFAAFSPKAKGRSSVVAVQLATRSDFVMTLTAITISLVPGSIVVEVDRGAGLAVQLPSQIIGADVLGQMKTIGEISLGPPLAVTGRYVDTGHGGIV